MSSVETEQMSAVETGQMSAAETGQMSAAETGHLSCLKRHLFQGGPGGSSLQPVDQIAIFGTHPGTQPGGTPDFAGSGPWRPLQAPGPSANHVLIRPEARGFLATILGLFKP